MSVAGENKFSRLPRTVIPIKYDISLAPDLLNYTFTGTECIKLEIKEPTEVIVLNVAEINIHEAKVNSVPVKTVMNAEEEKAYFSSDKPFSVGDITLEISFTGILNDRMKGFYRSTYKTALGKEKRLAVTQFQATDARRAFPCWDEPNFKASFEISLTVQKHLVALSNMPEKKRDVLDNDVVKIHFAATPKMSTYLVAFMVGELDHIEAVDDDGVLIRVFTPLGKVEMGRFALDVAVKTLPFYRKYFDIEYPLPKLDLIAIPDFAFGGMENWGLIGYREKCLLIDPEQSSHASRQNVALIVGHELAHMWFGNLVTLDWWTYLWLNEGFASWIEYLSVDLCFPEFDIWTYFVASDFASAQSLDSLKNSHPIEVPVTSPGEIDEIFDSISYCKGASVIRMLQNFLGAEKFRNGLRIYLKRHQYGSACTEDLWAALEEASSQPVNKMMDTWTKQTGYPILSVDRVKNADAGCFELNISQTRFVDSGNNETNDLWLVPITIANANEPSNTALYHKVVLSKSNERFALPDHLQSSPLLVNPGSIGFFRVHYSTDLLAGILKSLKDGKLTASDRFKIQNDLFALNRSGQVSFPELYSIFDCYADEHNYTVWSDFSGNIGQLRLLVDELNVGDTAFNNLIQKLAINNFKRLGWSEQPGESHNDRLLRPLMIGMLGRCGHQPILKEAQSKFASHFKEISSGDFKSDLRADIRGAVYSIVVKHGNQETINQMISLYDRTDLSEERSRILSCLGYVSGDYLQQVLDLSMSERVRLQDKSSALISCCKSKEGRHRTWTFFKQQWPYLKSVYAGPFLLTRLVKSICENFVTKEKAEEVKTFFSNEPPTCQRTVNQAVENILTNADHLQRDREHLKSCFST